MKLKQLIHLILILGVLVTLVWVKQTHKPAEIAVEEYVPLKLSFQTEQVKAIHLIKPKGSEEEFVELVQMDGKWKLKSLGQARVDQTKIEDFLKELQSAKGEQRSQKKELFADFAIGDDAAYQIKLLDGANKTLLDLRLGAKKAATALFLRHAGQNEVFFTGADLFGKMGVNDPKTDSLDNNYWAAGNLVELDASKVISIEGRRFKNAKELISAAVTRKAAEGQSSSGWRFTDPKVPFAADGEKIKSFVESFKTWRASRVMDPKDQKDLGFDKPQWQMVFELEGAGPVTVKAGKTDDASKTTYMQVSSEPVVFLLSPYYFENMDADNSRFFADNPLKAGIAETETLVVTSDKKRYEVHPQQKSWGDLNKTLEELKGFRPTRVLLSDEERKKVKSPSKFAVEVVSKDSTAPIILDLGDVVTEAPKEYAGVIRGTDYPFAVTGYFFSQLFDNLNRLEPPAETQPAAPPVPAPTPKTEEIK